MKKLSAERLNYLDSAKGFSILLVVLSHISNQFIVGIDPLAKWINSFDLPLFFIVSGFLISYKNENGQKYIDVVFKKVRTIMYPYFTFSVIYLLFRLFIGIIKIKFPLQEMYGIFIDTISLWGISTLWFLPTLFITEIIFILIIKIKNSLKSIILILFLFAIGIILGMNFCNTTDNLSIYIQAYSRFFIIISRSMTALFFVGVGYYFCKLKLKHFDKIDNNFKLLIGISLFIINILVSMEQIAVNLRIGLIENYPLYIFTGIIGSIAIIILFEQLKIATIFSYLGRNSLIVMATHLPFGVIAIARTLFLFAIPIIGGSNYLYVFSICIIVICLELAIAKIINSYMPFLIKIPKQLKNTK